MRTYNNINMAAFRAGWEQLTCALNGTDLTSVDPRIFVEEVVEESDTSPETAKKPTQGSLLMTPVGVDLRTIRVTVYVKERDLEERMKVLRSITAWAYHGGVLECGYRRGQQIRVKMSALPKLNAWDTRQRVELAFFALDGFWRDKMPVTVQTSGKTTAELVITPRGDLNCPLEAEITAQAAVTSVALTMGSQTLTFTGLSLQNGDVLKIVYDNNGFLTAKAGDVNRLTAATEKYLSDLKRINPEAMNIPFIANHDTDRAAGYLTMAGGRMAVAASLYLLTPGSPFIYYGEEIGLRGSRGGASTDANRRLAMLWGDGDTVRDPAGSDYTKQTTYSVADLLKMKGSLLHHYQKLLTVRKANPEIARGDYTALVFPDTKLGGFLCAWNGSTAAVIHNTTEKTLKVNLREATDQPLTVISAVIEAIPGEGGALLEDGVLTVGSQTSVVLR